MKQLTELDRSYLAMTMATPGFSIFCQLAEEARSELKDAMTDMDDDDAILKQHARCRGAAEFLAALLTRANNEIEILNNAKQAKEQEGKPMPDITEGMMQ